MKQRFIVSFLFSLVLLGGLFFYQYGKFIDNRLHVIFCDVGQGDAIHIRTPSGFDILVDGGPTDAVLSCLSESMPFWDRTIDAVVLTHPHQDHLAGLIPAIQRYTILSFYTENISNDSKSFGELLNLVKSSNIVFRYVYQGDLFRTKDGISFRILGPSKEFLRKTSPGGKIGEKSEFASVVTLVSYGSFETLLTGDSQTAGLKDALALTGSKSIEVLQVPHHGSKTGLDGSLLDILNPKFAVISVGKNNKYSHPTKQILDLLNENKIKVLRTDRDGKVEIVSDGKNYSIK